jgi:hypothetical protein
VEAASDRRDFQLAGLQPDEVAAQQLRRHGIDGQGSLRCDEEAEEGAQIMVVGKDGVRTQTSFDTEVSQEVVGQRVKIHGAALLAEVYSPPRGPP